MLVNASYRDSKREDTSDLFTANSAGTTGSGSENRQKIGTVEGSWVINDRSFATGKFTDFTLLSQGRPDHIADVTISTAAGTRLDVANLDTLGRLSVPQPIAGATAFNDFIAPLVARYGYPLDGVQTGGGFTGYAMQFDKNDFFRKAGQLGYNLTLGSAVRHTIHAGYQRYTDEEDLERSSNGWGTITVPGGRDGFEGTAHLLPGSLPAAIGRRGAGDPLGIPLAEHRGQRHHRGRRLVLQSRRAGEQRHALRPGPAQRLGHALGVRALPRKQVQDVRGSVQQDDPAPAGATWSYNGKDTVYASYATYNPAASSLPRAAAWDRNVLVTINAYFDQNGVLVRRPTRWRPPLASCSSPT